jgi:cyclopropane-fatty-acyl-phospholipid synthase
MSDLEVLPALYDADVVHARRQRVDRTFTHRISLWLVDLDALPALPWWLRPFGRFESADHLGAPDRSIRENLDTWLATQGVDLQGGRVVMLANARSLGHAFNPITLYWCSRLDGRPECVVAEVHNTYGERHCYLLRPDEQGCVETAKEFYVSPFLAMGGGYLMRVGRPGHHLSVGVSLRQRGRTVFNVQLRGTRHPAPGHPPPAGPHLAAPPVRHLPRLRADQAARDPTVAGPHPRAAPHTAHPSEGGPVSSSTISPWPVQTHPAHRSGSAKRERPVPEDVPRAPVRASLAQLAFRTGVRRMPIRVELPDGQRWGAGGPDDPVMRVARPAELFRRLGRDANIGFGEAYQAGDWSSPHLADLLTAMATQLTTVVSPGLQGLRIWAQRMREQLESNTRTVARRNVAAHYDLSNEMFAIFLDETMTYSCAWFDPHDSNDSDHGDSLTRAQLRKIDGVLDAAGVQAGSQVLEIGTGWGALSIRAAQRGATVTSLTLSAEQQRLAQQRVREAGVDDRVTVLLQDYREAVGQYDAVVSVEMIEAVGADYWPTYFAALDARLKPGGRVALQSITMPHERMLNSRRAYTWINKHIFPGGLIPSIDAIETTLAEHTGLRMTQRHDHGLDYARTLRCWRQRFLAQWETVAAMGFDDTFRRTWEYYLAYSEAGFRAGYLDVSLIQLQRDNGEPPFFALPDSRRL